MITMGLAEENWEIIRDALLFEAGAHEKASRRHVGKATRQFLVNRQHELEGLAAMIEARAKLAPTSTETDLS